MIEYAVMAVAGLVFLAGCAAVVLAVAYRMLRRPAPRASAPAPLVESGPPPSGLDQLGDGFRTLDEMAKTLAYRNLGQSFIDNRSVTIAAEVVTAMPTGPKAQPAPAA